MVEMLTTSSSPSSTLGTENEDEEDADDDERPHGLVPEANVGTFSTMMALVPRGMGTEPSLDCIC